MAVRRRRLHICFGGTETANNSYISPRFRQSLNIDIDTKTLFFYVGKNKFRRVEPRTSSPIEVQKMKNEQIHIERIKKLIAREQKQIYPAKAAVKVSYIHDLEPIPYAETETGTWREIEVGAAWGKLWSSAWFKIEATVPAELKGQKVGLWFDNEGEGCVWKDGSPWQGLTAGADWYHKAGKYFIPLEDTQAKQLILIEAAANGLFGGGRDVFHLKACHICTVDSELQSILRDMSLLLDLALALDKGQTRRKRILYGLNRVCDLWAQDKEQCKDILSKLLSQPANASALKAFSVGHAHLDLAWLWPLRETKRKGGRSFANALRLIEQYPGYIFGASQAQLYKWMKELYPKLYQEVKEAVKQGSWEVQGAGWVEFDTNLIGGESIIRQLSHGLRFFEQEFGVSPQGLWLPDCFGYSANLPQFLVGAGLEWFMTQKLSWNESNPFVDQLFIWEGIDGSRILAHQLPTHDYTFSNNPSSFLQTEARYAQAELCDSFLNLYGIGDGGGGPTHEHIEYGLRLQDLEGMPRFIFAKGQDFFDHIRDLDRELLPKYFGELYLEYHRGTYTTQALMKKNNRISEVLLSTAEYLAALLDKGYPRVLNEVWEDVLLLQFHDILPGSSIGEVYEDAHAISAHSHERLNTYITEGIRTLHSGEGFEHPVFAAFNAGAFEREEWLEFEAEYKDMRAVDEEGNEYPTLFWLDKVRVKAKLPAWGFAYVHWQAGSGSTYEAEPAANLCMENEHIKAEFTSRGTLSSLILKSKGREMLAQESNLIRLWEDEPNNWGAWDINHFYRDTVPWEPHEVKLLPQRCVQVEGCYHSLCFEIKIGSSTIIQQVELTDCAPYLKISHEVDWKEHHKMLRVHFYANVISDVASTEVAMGVYQRSTKPSNSFELAKFEFPAHTWVDLSQRDCGLALINDCKYGHRIVDNELEINLLRSPADVDPNADIHRHSYSYGILPHLGDRMQGGVLPQAHRFNTPVIVQEIAAEASFRLPEYGCQTEGVKLHTIKPADDSSGTVLRFYEYAGCDAELVISLPEDCQEAQLCDLRERLLETVTIDKGKLSLHFKPYEIKTLKLTKRGNK